MTNLHVPTLGREQRTPPNILLKLLIQAVSRSCERLRGDATLVFGRKLLLKAVRTCGITTVEVVFIGSSLPVTVGEW